MQYAYENESFYCMGMDDYVYITDRPGRLIICNLAGHEIVPMHGWGAPGLRVGDDDNPAIVAIENESISGGPFVVHPTNEEKVVLMGQNWCVQVDFERKVIDEVKDTFKTNVNLRSSVPNCMPAILDQENRSMTFLGNLSEGLKSYSLPNERNGEVWSVAQCDEIVSKEEP